jgi:hypothetical protein
MDSETSNTPRRWRIGSYRQSDEVRKGRGYVQSGDDFRTYGEHVSVREDRVTDDDVEAVRAWLRVNPRQAFTAENVRDLLSMVLGQR